MKPMVSEFVVNEEVVTFLFVSETPQVRQTKKDKPYLCLKLQDKTGAIDARVWEMPTDLDPNKLKSAVIKVRGQVTEWQDIRQLTISQMRVVNQDDQYDLGDFFERSERDPEEMFNELHDLLERNIKYDNPIKSLLFAILFKEKSSLLMAPAAKSVHHAYIGGLLEHVLSMCQVAIPICSHYSLRPDLVLAACVLHDIGKVRELTYPVGIGYSLPGTLLGHISLGMDMVSRAMDEVENFPQNLKIAVLHLIASHHGLLEYGSPKVPLMREAVAFHLIDMMDARNMICLRAEKKGLDEVGMTEWVKELGGPLFVLKADEAT